MKLIIVSSSAQKMGEVMLPPQFSEPVDTALIKRSVEVLQASARQPYGAKKGAGLRASATLSRKRRDYRGSYGRGISRVPRKVMSHSGTQFNFVGAVAPGMVGGRRAHPPVAEHDFTKKINKKENQKAIRSALAATVQQELVAKKHSIPDTYPFAVDNSFESIQKTKDAVLSLDKLGLQQELVRTSERKIRAGKGKIRGRKYRTKKGLLIVVGEECPLLKATKNLPGVDAVIVHELNTQLLAPGAVPGRATIFTKSALDKLSEKRLFAQ